MNTDDTSDTQDNTTPPRSEPWYKRLWVWSKQDYIATLSIATFTGVLAAVSIFQGYITRGQLSEMQKAQRPFIFAIPGFGNEWAKDSEHDMQITIGIYNAGSFPALHIIHSQPQVVMDTADKVGETLKHCPDISYPSEGMQSILAPASAGSASLMFAGTVRSGYIYDKARITNNIDLIAVYGGIKYSGVSGGDFETRYCYRFLPQGTFHWGYCECQSFK